MVFCQITVSDTFRWLMRREWSAWFLLEMLFELWWLSTVRNWTAWMLTYREVTRWWNLVCSTCNVTYLLNISNQRACKYALLCFLHLLSCGFIFPSCQYAMMCTNTVKTNSLIISIFMLLRIWLLLISLFDLIRKII